jgi:hypothetical protein
LEELQKALYDFGSACAEVVKAFANMFKGFQDVIIKAAKLQAAPNSRIKHLALYGRKARVRKKNYKRLLRGDAE